MSEEKNFIGPKSKRGRKPKGKDKRGYGLSIRLSPDEIAALKRLSGNKHTAAWARNVLLGAPMRPTIPAINQQAYAELARLAANANQYQQRINSGQAREWAPGEVQTLIEQIQALRSELMTRSSGQ